MPTSTTPTKSVARKAPQDRQPSKSERMAAQEQPPFGYEMLRPVAELRSSEQIELQATLTELFEALGVDFKKSKAAKEAGEEYVHEFDGDTPTALRTIGRLGMVLEDYVYDAELYVRTIDTGKGAPKRVMDLAMHYLASLGESDSSAS